LIACDIYL